MNEWEKAQAGYLYNANYDKEILKKRKICADLCFDLNQTRPSDGQKKKRNFKKNIYRYEKYSGFAGTFSV